MSSEKLKSLKENAKTIELLLEIDFLKKEAESLVDKNKELVCELDLLKEDLIVAKEQNAKWFNGQRNVNLLGKQFKAN